tara:strand:+ start:94 stop:447 length:354 start_codon:yes stop_codon:yes gene_type:complete
MSTYDPHRSSARTDTIAEWCRTEGVHAGDDIKNVPGVGKSLQSVLRANQINTIAQLLGIFLMEVDGEKTTQEVCQAFYDNMKELVAETSAKSVNMHVITFAVANFLAEKGLFDYDIE